ncbi:uncharacterized protein LOC115221699 [Octopus sinensis]|uniref:Uncharacterized protein LOC115221699 n=1 Tax=Octopus sinensis TaxID=2607531 RepID=A0A6P7TA16_9MOLL|nr:uncharacterized protein LOC115221699 [Octopus sinensis]
MDVNDNPPFFNDSVTNATLSMSTPVNTLVKPLIVALDVDKSNKILSVSCVSEAMNQSSANSGCEIFGVKTIKTNSSYWVGQLELLKPLVYDELQTTYYVTLMAYDGQFNSTPTTVAVIVEPIPTHLSYVPKPKLNQNVTVKCDFAFSGEFNETTIEILRANISVLTYSPETKTHKLSGNNEATKLKEIKSHQVGHHGYLSFKINLKSCHENNITCQTRDVEGKLHSVSHDLLTHNFIPSVKINRGTCIRLKRGSARVVCTGYSQEMTTTLKWYLTTDEGDYKETNGVETIDSPPKYDYTKCVYVQKSTIVLDYKGKRRNAKCVMVSEVANRKVELVDDVFSVGNEVPPGKLQMVKKCTGVRKGAVKIVCFGDVGHPAGNLRIFEVNEANSRIYQVTGDEMEIKEPKYIMIRALTSAVSPFCTPKTGGQRRHIFVKHKC